MYGMGTGAGSSFLEELCANDSVSGLALQLQDFRVGQVKEPYIRVTTRELDRELCTRLSTLYTNYLWSMLYYFSLP